MRQNSNGSLDTRILGPQSEMLMYINNNGNMLKPDHSNVDDDDNNDDF